MQYRILLVDDDTLILGTLKMFLEQKGYSVTTVATDEQAVHAVSTSSEAYALVVLDYQLGGSDGAKLARKLHAVSPELYILIYSGTGSRDAIKDTWAAGAVGFVEKGADPEILFQEIANWCKKYEETRRTLNAFDAEMAENCFLPSLGMAGRSRALMELSVKVERYRSSTQNILILGETGTGKELIARALHFPERGQFFAINCAAYKGSSDLLESELFGYERGAFTGADREKKGILEICQGGTLFLDEVHHLGLTAQAKLLRVCQEKKIRRVGGSKEIPVDFRLISASKPDMESLCARGEFLRDLYHRLDVLSVSLPPLRDRKEDIEPLVALFCRKHLENTGEKKTLLMRTLKHLKNYSWPGNVRELENTIYRLLTDSTTDKVGPELLDAKFFNAELETGTLSYDALRERHEREEREYLREILRASRSKTEAAEKLKLSPSTLHSIMKRLGLYSESAH